MTSDDVSGEALPWTGDAAMMLVYTLRISVVGGCAAAYPGLD